MKIAGVSINMGFSSGEDILRVARAAEEGGLESLWTAEHFLIPIEPRTKHPYKPDGKLGLAPDFPFADPFVTLGAIAAHTKTIRLGTGISVMPLYNPLHLAKLAASIDFMSNGRFMLGLALGWMRDEFEAMGIDFTNRGKRFDDALEALPKVWSGEVVEHASPFMSWSGFQSYPLPVQKRLPIHIGGDGEKALSRIARFGQGWFSIRINPEDMKDGLHLLKEACARAGRDVSEIEITVPWVGGPADDLKRFRDIGVHRVCFQFGAGLTQALKLVDKLAEETIPSLR